MTPVPLNDKQLQRMRAICGALADVTETPHFESTVFRVRGKIFTSVGDKNGIVVQLEPTRAAKLLASDSRFSPYPRAKDTLMFDPSTMKVAELRALVEESYRLGAEKNPKKTKKKK